MEAFSCPRLIFGTLCVIKTKMLKKIIQNIIGEDNKEPKAVQCLWYSDFEYIALDIELVFKSKQGYKKEKVTTLNYMDFENQKELSEEAKRIGKTLAEKHNAEFYFPSPDEWSRDCPDWWLSKTAFKCEDCGTPIIQTDSKHLPKEVCYPCHLTREQNQRIIEEKPYDDGVNMYLYKNGEFQSLGYCSNFESFKIAPFVKEKVEAINNELGIKIVTISQPEIEKLIQDLEVEIDKQLLEYKKPNIEKRMSRFVTTQKVKYKEKEFELMNRFNSNHENLRGLISSFDRAKKAFSENFEYKIYFKNGITHKDDSILRFINYSGKGKMKFDKIYERFNGIISTEEVDRTIDKLIKISCLKLNNDEAEVTETGKNVL